MNYSKYFDMVILLSLVAFKINVTKVFPKS